MVAKKKKSSKKKKAVNSVSFQSFKLCKESDNFVTFKLTKQTLYWAVLLIYILFIALWVSNAQLNAMTLLV